eukprot:TRINITY_DN1970_c0_g1_i1.p1 TRINITY_DN1970_c0_g1~~TRINITY_DN1970_c0_g1_i1.p1  ORF type:complete len:582 (+),score=63.53 TRINITY_DN1970_c0_g1_i1:308-2053(+)
MFSSFYNVYSAIYYTETLKTDITAFNDATSLQSLIIVLEFPLFGWLQDITRTRFGRRKPWLMVMVPLMFISTTLVWFPPSGWKAGWYFLWGTISLTTSFATLTPYSALGVEISHDYNQRSVLFCFSTVFHLIGYLIGSSFPSFLCNFYSDTQQVYFWFSICATLLGIFTFTLLFVFIREPEYKESDNRVPLISGLRFALLYNKPFQLLLICVTLQNAAPSLVSFLPFWVQYTLELSDMWQSLLISLSVGLGILTIPIFTVMSTKFGKSRTYQLTLFGSAFVLILICLPGYLPLKTLFTKIFVTVLITIYGLNGTAMTFSNSLYLSLQGDVIDYDELLTGLRRESQYTNVMQFFNWLFNLTGSVLPLAAINKLGYNETLQFQSNTVRYGIGYILGPVAALFIFAAALILFFYPITHETFMKIKKGLQDHKHGLDAFDPITGKMVPPHYTAQTMRMESMFSEDAEAQESFVLRSHQTNIDFDLKWILLHFAKIELELAAKKGIHILWLTNSLFFSSWVVGFSGGIVLTTYHPQLFQFVCFWLLFCLSMMFYSLGQLLAVWQLYKLKSPPQQIKDFTRFLNSIG